MTYPFKLEEVLASNKQVEWTATNVGGVPVIVSDNVLVDYTKMRDIAVQSPARMWKNLDGGKIFVDYYDCRQLFGGAKNDLQKMTVDAVEHFFGVRVESYVDIYTNWFKQIAPKRSDISIPHSDHKRGPTSFTVITYLNNQQECSGGTAFLRHRASGRTFLRGEDKAVFYDAYDGLTEDGSDYWCEIKRGEWEIVGVVDMKPGRTIVFPSEFIHAAFHPDDGFFDSPRLTMVYWQTL